MCSALVSDETPAWRFCLSVHEAWEAMHADCLRATKSIFLEQYILEKDAVGARFMEMFTQKAREGVEIFVMCDKFGSWRLHGSRLVRNLRRAGGRFHFYNPITAWDILRPWRWFPRTHAKTLLIDGEVAYTGGVCMASRMKTWRDTHIRLTEKAAVAQVAAEFEALKTRRPPPAPQKAEEPFRYLMNHPHYGSHPVYLAIMESIGNANACVYIGSAYFVPHERFLRLLEAKAREGVDVRLVVPERSDAPLADWLCLSYATRLRRAGVRVFLYRETMYHCKTAVVDNSWCTVGSVNFDVISFFHNREANAIITQPEAVAEMKAQFAQDFRNSLELTEETWRTVPLWKLALGYAARALKLFLKDSPWLRRRY